MRESQIPGTTIDPDATLGHAPAQHATRFLQGFRVHILLCRGSGLPVLFLLSPAHQHDTPFARPLLTWAVHLYSLRPRIVRLDAASWGLALIHWTTRHRCRAHRTPTAPASRPPGPRMNWASAAALRASLAGSSSSSVCSARPSLVGRPSHRPSPSPMPPPLLSPCSLTTPAGLTSSASPSASLLTPGRASLEFGNALRKVNLRYMLDIG